MLPVLFSLHQDVPCVALVCQQPLPKSKDAVLVSQTAQITYQSPLTITKGGTYSGNWQSLDANVPTVKIQTSDPVIIENSNLRGRGRLIQATDGADGANVTVRNTYGYGLNPNVSGKYPGEFLVTYAAANVVVENCYMESTSGMYLYSPKDNGTVRIRYNRAHNIDGRKSDGNGGFIQDSFAAHFLLLGHAKNIPGIEIAWNEVINEPYKSSVEENINIYNSSGTSSSPILVHDNYIQGAYPANPAKDSYTGGGIIIDPVGETTSDNIGFVKGYNNHIVSTTNQGIAIEGGHDNEFYNNRLVSSGLMSDGTHIAAQFTGAFVWDINGEGNGRFYNNSVHDNTIGWVGANGTRNDTSFRSCASDKCYNNTSLPNPITLNTEKAEYQTWLNKVSANKVKIGPQ